MERIKYGYEHSLVEPPDALVLYVQLKRPHDDGRDAVRARMTALDEARTGDESFPAGLTAVLMELAHNRTAMFCYFAVRIDVADARQLPRDGEYRSIEV